MLQICVLLFKPKKVGFVSLTAAAFLYHVLKLGQFIEAALHFPHTELSHIKLLNYFTLLEGGLVHCSSPHKIKLAQDEK